MKQKSIHCISGIFGIALSSTFSVGLNHEFLPPMPPGRLERPVPSALPKIRRLSYKTSPLQSTKKRKRRLFPQNCLFPIPTAHKFYTICLNFPKLRTGHPIFTFSASSCSSVSIIFPLYTFYTHCAGRGRIGRVENLRLPGSLPLKFFHGNINKIRFILFQTHDHVNR